MDSTASGILRICLPLPAMFSMIARSVGASDDTP